METRAGSGSSPAVGVRTSGSGQTRGTVRDSESWVESVVVTTHSPSGRDRGSVVCQGVPPLVGRSGWLGRSADPEVLVFLVDD